MIEFIYYSNIFSCLTIGLGLLFLKTIPKLTDVHYRNGKYFLAVASIIVGLANAIIMYQEGIEQSVEMLSMPVLITTQLQACLFTFLVLTLFHSPYVNWSNIIKCLIPTFIFIVIYCITVIISPDVTIHSLSQYRDNITNPGVILRSVFVVICFIQIAIYICLYQRERKIYLNKIDNYFSDYNRYKMGWSSRLFYQASSIGIIVLVFSLTPSMLFNIILTICITGFYFSFSIQYINYQYHLFYALPAINEDTPTDAPEEVADLDTNIDSQLEANLNSLLLFRQQGVVLADYAQLLKISDRKLSTYINTTHGVTFKRWVNAKRIEYAKQIIDEYPDSSMDRIAEDSGFADKSHFSRIFREISGVSFTEHRNTSK